MILSVQGSGHERKEGIMDKNQGYIQNLTMEQVPWHRLSTAYGRSTRFPEYFKILQSTEDAEAARKALGEITSNIEHQGTLWYATPFALIFLVRLLEKAASELEQNKAARYIGEELLDFFQVIVECVQFMEEEADVADVEEEPFPLFSDLLDEQYLWSEEYDEDDELEEQEDSEDIFYSVYYYSFQALLSVRPLLEGLKGTVLEKRAAVLEESLEEMAE